VIGVEPLHVPLSAVKVWPSWAVPEIVGAPVFAGAFPKTGAVVVEVAVEFPALLVPLTLTWNFEPTSGLVRT
jgi:hypothetical protein